MASMSVPRRAVSLHPALGQGQARRMGIRLTPAGRLRWEPSGDEAAPGAPPYLQGAFETDWRDALFTLAAEKTPTGDMPSVRYWQQLAERHFTGLCHVPEDAESFEVVTLSSADCARWILTPPPMHGGEYLCEETRLRGGGSARPRGADYAHGRAFAPDRNEEERASAVVNILKANAGEASMMARCAGKTRLHNIEPEDLRSITRATAAATGIPLAGTRAA